MDKTLRQKYEVPPEKLRYECDIQEFKFKTTEELEGLESIIIGQERGLESLKAGLELNDKHNHIFVTCPPGIGKNIILRKMIGDYLENLSPEEYEEKIARKKDLVAIYNFEDPSQPIIIEFPVTKGRSFQEYIEKSTEKVLNQEIKRYKQKLATPAKIYNQKLNTITNTLAQEKELIEIEIMKLDGKIGELNDEIESISKDDTLSPKDKKGNQKRIKEIEQLSEKLKQQEQKLSKADQYFQEAYNILQGDYYKEKERLQEEHEKNIHSIINEVRQDYANQESIEKLRGEIIDKRRQYFELKIRGKEEGLSSNERKQKETIRNTLDKLNKEYSKEVKLKDYLDAIEKELQKDSKELIESKPKISQDAEQAFMMIGVYQQNNDESSKYKVNVLNKQDTKKTEFIEKIPVIFESKPTLENLFGTIDMQQSLLNTDDIVQKKKDMHMRMKAGSLIKANGGYLIINVMDLILDNPTDSIRRLIKDLEREKTNIGQQLPSYFSAGRTESEDINLNVKVLLTGTNSIYQSLLSLSKGTGIYEEFRKTFGIKAELDSIVNNTEKSREQYANFIARVCKKEGLKPVTPQGVAEIIRYSARLADQQGKLTLNLSEIANIIRESNIKSGENEHINQDHVKKAIKAKRKRHNLREERIREYINEGIRIIDTEKELVGEINALVVYGLEDIKFGCPSKLTVTTSKGEEGIVSLDVEAGNSGKTFKKAIYTLEKTTKELFAQDKIISLSGGISLEQSYGGIEGDSATLASFLALMSNLGDAPIDQEIAVTGSLNQKGRVQPIGGVNEKIEGFYHVCETRGLTDNQGVIIPKINEKELTLSDEVIDSVKEGKFHIYSVSTREEAIEIIMGMKAFNKPENKTRGEETLYARVDRKLRKYNKQPSKKNKKE